MGAPAGHTSRMPTLDGRLLSLLGHELRAPAGVIGGYLAMLERADAGLSPTQQRAVEGARRAQQVAVEILEDVSRLAAVARDATPVRIGRLPVATLVAGALATAQGRDATVAVAGTPPDVAVHGDPAATPAAVGTIAAAIAREHGVAVACAVDAGAEVVTLRFAVDGAPALAEGSTFNDLRPGLGLRLVVAVDHVVRLRGRVVELESDGRSYGALVELPRA